MSSSCPKVGMACSDFPPSFPFQTRYFIYLCVNFTLHFIPVSLHNILMKGESLSCTWVTGCSHFWAEGEVLR